MELASEKQKGLMDKLKIAYHPQISKLEAHKAIEAVLGPSDKSQKEESVPTAYSSKDKSIVAQCLTKCWAELNTGEKLGPQAVLDVYNSFLNQL